MRTCLSPNKFYRAHVLLRSLMSAIHPDTLNKGKGDTPYVEKHILNLIEIFDTVKGQSAISLASPAKEKKNFTVKGWPLPLTLLLAVQFVRNF